MDGFTCAELIDIAKRYAPILMFDRRQDGRNEDFFPINVESWLSHTANFTEDVPNCPERGTSVWQYPAFQGDCPEVNAGMLHLVPAGPNDPNHIGNDKFKKDPAPSTPQAPNGWALNFGSWSPWANPGADSSTISDFAARSQGNLKYLFEVYDAVRPVSRPAGTGPATPSPAPTIPAPFGPGLSCYCEVARGDELARTAFISSEDPEASAAIADDTEAVRKLADYLVLTYHYFYPAMQPFKPFKFMEGQWEAISVFVKMFGSKQEMRPRFVAYSQGYEHNRNTWWVPRVAAESWSAPNTQLQKAEGSPDHPLAYVAWGTHGNYFGPQLSPIKTDGPNTAEIIGASIFAAGWVTALIGIIALNPVVAVVGVIIAFIGWLILLFASLCGDDDADESSEVPTYLPETDPAVTDHHNGEGPAVAPPGAPPPVPGAAAPSSFVLHLIDPSDPQARRDSQPSVGADGQPTECEYPYWWDYVGRWGVKVDDDTSKGRSETSSSWMHGSRRVDELGVSRAVINMRSLLTLVSADSRPDYDL